MVTKKQTKSFYRYLFIAVVFFFGILGTFLVLECYYFYAQAQALCELKEDYNRYASALKKIMRDYNKTKERLDLLENTIESEKKNEITEMQPNGHDDEFVLINRDLSYLKGAALAHIVQEYDKEFFSEFPEDEWIEYTDAYSTSDEIDQSVQPDKSKQKDLKQPPRPTIKKKQAHEQSIASDIDFIWPVERSKFWISSLFGPRTKANGVPGFHYGLDMAAFRGTPVRAASKGIVVEARYARGYGKTVLISHNKKYKTRYAHLDKIHVYAGQKVNQGYVIGLVGATGNVRALGKDGSHLHFEVYSFNQRVNPLYFLMD